MDWKELGKKLVGLGAPVVGGALGGPAGAAVGAAIGAALGTDVDPDAIDMAVGKDPAATVATINGLEEAVPGIVYEHMGRALETVAATQWREMTAHSALQRNWRPLWGIGANVVWFSTGIALVAAIVVAIVSGDVAALSAVASALSSLAWFYTAPLAVVGVVAWGRTAEKTAVLGRDKGPGLVEAIAGRIAGAGG